VGAALLGARLLGLPRRWAVVGALGWGPAAAGVLSGQNTSVALLLTVAAAIALARGRDAAGGAWAGILTYKPQLAAPVVGLLAVRWRPVALIAVGALLIGQYVAGVIATGGDLAWPAAWLESLRAYRLPDFLANGWQAVSLPALGYRLELATGIPGLELLGFAAGVAIVLAFLPAMRRLPPAESVALAGACGLALSPHAWVYDATLLLPALGVVVVRAAERGWPWRDRWAVAAAFAIALSWPLGGVVGVTLLPLLVVAAPFALADPWRPGRTPRRVASAA
jgi:hypothetical protein